MDRRVERMPILFGPFVGMALGVALAFIAADELASDDGSLVASRAFAVTVAFAAFVWLPVVGYFAAFHADWSYLYAVPSRRVPSAVDLALVLLGGAAVVLGFVLAADAARKRRSSAVAVLGGAPVAIVVLALPFVARRLAVSATFAQFHGDFGVEPLVGSLLGKGLLLMGLVLAAGFGWAAYSLARMGSEAAAASRRSTAEVKGDCE